MKVSTSLKSALIGCAYVSALTFAPLSFDLDNGLSYSVAQAKGGNSNGNSNGNSGSHSKGNSSANASSNDNSSDSDSASGSSNTGSLAKALGRLNAAHASENALAHASANSVVGALAQYKAAVQETNALTMKENTLNETIQSLEAQLATTTDKTQIAALNAQLAAAQAELAETQTQLAISSQIEADSLATAANKEITDEVVTATNELLGIKE